jgi:hypothetical protein
MWYLVCCRPAACRLFKHAHDDVRKAAGVYRRGRPGGVMHNAVPECVDVLALKCVCINVYVPFVCVCVCVCAYGRVIPSVGATQGPYQ